MPVAIVLRVARLSLAIALVVSASAVVAVAYIHFPPGTLPKMCQHSQYIRVLKVQKFDRQTGVILFENSETLKNSPQKQPPGPDIATCKHLIRPGAAGVQPISQWLEKDKTAVMFSIEGPGREISIGCSYVFIDHYCYSLDYNTRGKYWALIRAEPDMAACYFGPADGLPPLVKDILAGKEVKVPMKEPLVKGNHDQRFKEVTEMLETNRGIIKESPGK